MGLFVYVRLLFCFITAYAPEKVDVGVFWTSFLKKFFRFDEKNSCASPSCMLYWWCIYHPGMTLTTRSRGVRETHRTESLILTVVAEVPVVSWGLRKEIRDRKRGCLVTAAANVLTTVMVAGIERILCYGQW